MKDNVKVTKMEIVCVKGQDGFALYNAETKEVWPISKQGMLTLAGQLDKWFQEIAKKDQAE